MSPLSEVGKGELTFDVNGTVLTLRALTPNEEIEVQRNARSILAEGDITDQVNMLEYLDRFRIGSIAYSLVQVGDLDFRNLETIETGATLPGGTRVKVKRHEALAELVGTWSRNMVVAVFRKFGELMTKVEKEVEDLIDFEPVDYDSEISRLEERLRELREEKARMSATEVDARTNLRNQVASSTTSFRAPAGALPAKEGTDIENQQRTPGESATVNVPSDIEREIEEGEENLEENLEEEPSEPAEPTPRVPVYARGDGRMPPPAPVPPSVPAEALEGAGRDEGLSEEELAQVSSFVDMSDPESAEKAAHAENLRILEMRRRRPPHMAAKQVAEAHLPPERPVLTDQTIAGKPVYKMPTQNLTDRGKVTPPARTPGKGNANPRFKPPTR